MRWDPRKRRYVDDRGRVLSEREVRQEIDDYIKGRQKAVRDEADKLLAGTITLAAFFLFMRDEVEKAHKIAGSIAYGGKAQVDKVRADRITESIESELAYLSQFQQEARTAFAAARAEEIPITESEIAGSVSARAEMYINAAYSTYENNVADREADFGVTMARRICEEDGASCEDCVEAATDDFMPLDEVSDIGSLQCMNNCVVAGTLMSGRFIGCFKALYSGDIINLRTASGKSLTITPNHPVLTDVGFVPANKLKEGDCLICECGHIHPSATLNDHQQPPTRIEEIFGSLAKVGWSGALRRRSVDFHGDAGNMQGDVEIVATDRMLLGNTPTVTKQSARQFILKSTTKGLQTLASLRTSVEYRRGFPFSSDGVPSRGSLSSNDFETFLPRQSFSIAAISNLNAKPLETLPQTHAADAQVRGKFQHAVTSPVSVRGFDNVDSLAHEILASSNTEPLTFGQCANMNVALDQPAAEDAGSDAKFLSELRERFAALITADPIVELAWDRSRMPRHVYDLSTEYGWQSANGIIIANCRCYYEFSYAGIEGIRIDETVDRIFNRSEALQ